MMETRLRQLYRKGALDIPFPGAGRTAERHRQLADWARADLSLARLAEAHADAMAILHEAGRQPDDGLYGVWAAETPGHGLRLDSGAVTGSKMFCSGAGLIDHALVTVKGRLLDVDLRCCPESLAMDETVWKPLAFAETNTATVHFLDTPVSQIVAEDDWYLKRTGFWHGACGPAACWAGGALGLLDYALNTVRDEPHALAHVGGISADGWALQAYLDAAGCQIDQDPNDGELAQTLALTVRHLVEQAASDVLRRIGRAFGPRPLAFDCGVSKRYQELELYIRQSHAERDLEALGQGLMKRRPVEVLPSMSSSNGAGNRNGSPVVKQGRG
jgi:alkylation response protein AidB-like acyl-CoA dehydrogenase